MKKKLFIIIPALVLTATLLVGCNVEWGIKSRNNNNNSDDSSQNNITMYDENINKTIPMDGIENVDIDLFASNVTINSVDDSDLTIVCKGSSTVVDKTTIEVNGDTLNIKENGVGSNFGFNFNFDLINTSNTRELIINIPKDFNKDLKLTCGAGNVNLNGITTNELTIDGGAGNLYIKDLVFNELSLTQGVGNTDVDLKSKSGDMDIHGGVGNLTLKLEDVGGDLDYDGGVGNTIIYLPDNSPVKIETSSGVGSININAKTSGENTYIFDLSLGVGRITVN